MTISVYQQLHHCDSLTCLQYFSYIRRCFSLTANSLAFIQFRVYTFLSFDYKLTEVKSIETSKIIPFSSANNQTLYCTQTCAMNFITFQFVTNRLNW